jgi:hypothetical protein
VRNYIYWLSLKKVQEKPEKNTDNTTSEDGDVDIMTLY